MNYIFSSTLYKGSNHKDKIHSALNNPINSELVQQLKEYLDDDSLRSIMPDRSDSVADVDSKPASRDDSSNNFSKSNTDDNADMSKATKPVSRHPIPPSAPPISDPLSKEPSDMNETITDNLSDDADSKPEDVKEPSESSESSESSVSSAINCCCSTEKLSSDIDVIRGMLNSREDTRGVSHILVKSSEELWISYDDSINLNSVMGPVIELLNASGYTYLEFNRLARSDNAIVFQISFLSTNKNILPISGD